MTVAVLGPGGVGGMIAARTDAICVGTSRTVAAIDEHGLTLTHGDRRVATRVRAVERLAEPVDVIVVAVKAMQLDDALDRLDPEAIGDPLVLPLQNGLEHVERIRARLGSLLVAAGSIARVEVHTPAPGVVVQRSPGALITAAADGVPPAELERALAPLRVDGLEVVVGASERAVLWEKAARLAVLAAGTIAAGGPVGRLRSQEPWATRARAALAESCRAAELEGVALAPAGQWEIIESLPASLLPSTARDAAAGRPTELDAITGSVVRAGRRHGLPMAALGGLLDDAARVARLTEAAT